MIAGTVYDVNIQIEIGSLTYKKVVKSITVPESTIQENNVTFSVEASKEVTGQADYKIQIQNYEESSNAILYYRLQGSTENYAYKTISLSGSKLIEGSVNNLQQGGTYDFVLLADGIKKETAATLGIAETQLVKVGEDEINAFDFVRTCKVESSGEMAGAYYLEMYYMPNGGRYTELGSATLNADNEYQVTIKSANYKRLSPNTEYKIKCTLSTGADGTPIFTCYDTVHTASAEEVFTYKVTNSSRDEQEYIITLNQNSIANFSNFNNIYLYAYIRTKGEKYYQSAGSVHLSTYSEWSEKIRFKELEDNTEYEVSMRDENGVEYFSFTFTTPKDMRSITITSVTPGLNDAYLGYSLSGTSTESGYLTLFLKEKGTTDVWKKEITYWYSQWSSIGSLHISSYNNKPLKAGTTYEYCIGFGDYGVTRISDLKNACSGEFKTLEDTRILSGTGVSTGYTIANINANFSGNDANIGSYIYCFYKAENAENWLNLGYSYYNESSAVFSKMISNLLPGTTYDYAVVISDQDDCSSPDAISAGDRKVVSQFTTKKNDYTLDFKIEEEKSSYNNTVVTVAAKGSTADSFVQVALTLSDGQEQTVLLKRGSNYTENVTFSNLFPETEYTISKAVLYVTENNNLIQLAELDCNYKFTTRKAETPTTITLSESAVALNAVYAGTGMEGFDLKNLKAEIQPKTAAKDLVWSSSNETVATVSSTGTVYAQGVGTAVITVESRYDETVKTSCSVTVKEFVIGCKEADGTIKALSIAEDFNIYKNSNINGLAFYEQSADGKLTLLTDYTITPVKEGIVSWNAGSLKADSVGTTRVDFEKDGVKAAINVNVTVGGKGFDVTGFTSSNSRYPAIANEDGSYTLALTDGVTYTAVGEISPKQNFLTQDFAWSVSDTAVATVSSTGVITPVKAGTVTLTVTPKNYYADVPYIQDKITVELNIKDFPAERNGTIIYALANVNSKIGDVNFPESWSDGWKWEYPDTPLITNNSNDVSYYDFKAIYSGTEHYPIEAVFRVYIGRITGVYASEWVNGTIHNHVLETGGSDSIRLSVDIISQGLVSDDAYTVELPAVEGLTFVEETPGVYTVTAQKAGKYILKPQVRAKENNQVLATSTYQINAVEAKQVADIWFTTDTEGVTIEGNKVIFDTVPDKKDFNLKAIVVDRNGEMLETALQWKITDKQVASVAAASKQDTHTAKVSVKGEGHAVITVVAKDAAGYQAELAVEVRNHSPRVDTNKATVNIAYDYDDYNGRSLASNAGLVEIVPVYGDTIRSIQLLDKNNKTVIPEFSLTLYSEYKYLVVPTQDEIKTGTYDCILRVTTGAGSEYDYSLKVSVVNKKPSVSAKMSSPINLFYTNEMGTIQLTISDKAMLSEVTWQDESNGAGNGFSMTGYSYTSSGKQYSWVNVSQEEMIEIANGKLKDPSVAKGTLEIELIGYREKYYIRNFSVKYNYKKPTLVTVNANSSIVPSVGQNGNAFCIYDKTNKSYLYYDSESSGTYSYNEVLCEDKDVELTVADGSYYTEYVYSGKENSRKITLTLNSMGWREPVETTHTIKVIKPKAYLSYGTFTFNTSTPDTCYAYVYMNGYSINYSDIVIKGSNAKAQKLLDDDLLVMTGGVEYGNGIQIRMNNSKLMNTTIPAGTYSYKVTPYYTNVETGKKTAMNTLTLKINIINKPVTARVSPNGSLDLAYGSNSILSSKKNIVFVDPKFSNMASGYSLESCKLVGEYSDYFDLEQGYSKGWHYYLTVGSYGVGRLKAGQAYKLAIEYTLSTSDGNKFTVTSNTFTVKPKQSQPKVTILDNNQTLYASAPDMYRYYTLSVPDGCSIDSATGSLDCNKDGVADIVVSGSYDTLCVQITDSDAVGATVSGKSYSIPVTLELRGRDGISKDATVTINVKIKR